MSFYLCNKCNGDFVYLSGPTCSRCLSEDAAIAAANKPPSTKPNYLLMPLQVLEGVAKTFMAAAKKHDNDSTGIGWKRLKKDQATKDKYDEKALRHLIQAFSGEGVDEESGVDHRYHAIADLMIRMTLEE